MPTRPVRRARTYGYRTPRAAIPADTITAPPRQAVIPTEYRDRLPGFCARCDHPAILGFGPDDTALCHPCRALGALLWAAPAAPR
jgi:hypothetical protein